MGGRDRDRDQQESRNWVRNTALGVVLFLFGTVSSLVADRLHIEALLTSTVTEIGNIKHSMESKIDRGEFEILRDELRNLDKKLDRLIEMERSRH